jgi:hypothetical protein
MNYSLPLFADEPAPAPPRSAPVPRVTFTGPFERRALVITESFSAWVAWRLAHSAEYGAAVWLLEGASVQAWNQDAFEVVRLDQ